MPVMDIGAKKIRNGGMLGDGTEQRIYGVKLARGRTKPGFGRGGQRSRWRGHKRGEHKQKGDGRCVCKHEVTAKSMRANRK